MKLNRNLMRKRKLNRNLNRKLSLMSRITISTIVILFITIVISTMLSLGFSMEILNSKVHDNLKTISAALSESYLVIDALEYKHPNARLNEYIDRIIASSTDIDVITVADMNSRRYYHVDKEKIGKKFVGGDEGQVFTGQDYASVAVGTRGRQYRYFFPVYGHNDEQIGFVMASYLMDNFETLKNKVIFSYLSLAAIVFMLGTIAAYIVSSGIKRILLGYEPTQIVTLMIEKEGVLNSLEEGIIAVNSLGKVIFVNQTCCDMLGKGAEEAYDQDIDEVLPGTELKSVAARGGKLRNIQMSISDMDILYDMRPIIEKNKIVGAVAILRNRTEVKRLAEQLTGFNHFADALRNNTHEFMNRLHVILGLLGTKQYADAISYISAVTKSQNNIVTTVTGNIENKRVAALILGKISRGHELGIQVNLIPSSRLPARSRFLTSASCVTIIGNLLENAFDAINVRDMDFDGAGEIILWVMEDDQCLVITVEDTGIGMTAEELARINRGKFSTKGEVRGTGLTLIKAIVKNHNGQMLIDSEKGVGTSISIIITEREEPGR